MHLLQTYHNGKGIALNLLFMKQDASFKEFNLSKQVLLHLSFHEFDSVSSNASGFQVPKWIGKQSEDIRAAVDVDYRLFTKGRPQNGSCPLTSYTSHDPSDSLLCWHCCTIHI